MYRRVITFCSAILLHATLYGQLLGCGSNVPPQSVAFGNGEWFKFAVAYSAPLINAEVADITFSTTTDHYMGRACYKIEAKGESRPFYSLFFSLKDTYTTWIEQSTLRPIKATSNQHEGSYRFRSAFDFDYQKLIVRTEGHNLRDQTTRKHTMKLSECSYDAVSLFYNLRSANLSNLRKGEIQRVNLVLEDTVRNINFKFMGREIRKIQDIGSFRTLKFACQFATNNDEAFKDGAEFYVWLSDDENRVPIYLESPIRVGKVYAKLTSWSDLKHPFSSFVVKN